jgi:hypothetical protein
MARYSPEAGMASHRYQAVLTLVAVGCIMHQVREGCSDHTQCIDLPDWCSPSLVFNAASMQHDSRFQIDRPDLILHCSSTLFSFGVVSQLDKQWRSIGIRDIIECVGRTLSATHKSKYDDAGIDREIGGILVRILVCLAPSLNKVGE